MTSRSPVLAKDTSTWRLISGLALDSEKNFYIYPLFWENGLTERLTLVWMPLPFEFRYLLSSTENSWLTLEASFLGSVYSRFENFDWRPSLFLGWKQSISHDLAFSTGAFFQAEISRYSIGYLSRTFAIPFKFGIQATSKISIWPTLWLLNERGKIYARYLGDVPRDNLDRRASDVKWRVPFGMEVTYQLHPQWEIWANLMIYKAGYDSDYLGLPLYITLVHTW